MFVPFRLRWRLGAAACLGLCGVAVTAACSKSPTPADAASAPKVVPPAPSSEAATPAPVAAGSSPQPGLVAAVPDPAGAPPRIDPPWYRPTILEGAKLLSDTRSEVNAAGLSSSRMLFELPKGFDRKACAQALRTAVQGSVPNVLTTETADRIMLNGDTPEYSFSFVCGDEKAYVGFEWRR